MAVDQMNENAWQKRRRLGGWADGYVEWIDGDTAYLSVVFSWYLNRAYQRAIWLARMGYRVRAGGPAVMLNPNVLSSVADVSGNILALQHHNPNATFTSRGCIRQCPFCAVPKIEGDLIELDNWEPKPIVCDNNLLACSRAHFDQVIDRLKHVNGVDFNQGLDARLLTKYHAERLAELDYKWLRLAWDDMRLESQFMRAWETLHDSGIPNGKICVYVLIGFDDEPDDALYRLSTIWKLGSWPFPMRYQPLDAKRRNGHVGNNWTEHELKRYTRYWSNLRHLSAVPFEEFRL